MTKNFQEFVASRHKNSNDDSAYMQIAVRAAEHAKSNGENPHGAVLVFPDRHMVEHDTCFTERDHTCHAEMNVLRKAARMKLRSLEDCVLYTTVEPCPMCAHAAQISGVKAIVFGAYDTKNGFWSSGKSSELAVKGGVMAEQCIGLIQESNREHLRGEQFDG